MTLKKKILTGYGVAFVLLGLVIVWAIVNLVSLGKASEAILSENYRSILAAENMIDALERQDSGVLLLFLGDREKGVTQFRDNEADFLAWLARARDNITIPGEAELVKAIEDRYSEYRLQFSKLTDLPEQDRKIGPISLYRETNHPLFSGVRESCVQLRQLNEKTMYTASVKADGVANRAIWSTALVASIALLVAFIFSLFLAERIVRPIRGVMAASRKISSGDYTVRVEADSGDELGRLAGEFNRMAGQLDSFQRMNIDQIIAEKNKGEAILSSIEDGLVIFDVELMVTGINPAARRMLAVDPAQQLPRSCEQIISDPALCESIGRTAATGAPPLVPEEQRIIVLPEGERFRHYLYSVTAIRGRDNSLSGIVLVFRDVTRLKEVEQLKNDFIMAASHELRTPLTSLGMSVDLLMEHVLEMLPDQEQELLQAAHEEVHRLKALVGDLLDLSRMEAGQIRMDFEKVHITTLFSSIQTVFKSQATMKQVQLMSHLPEDLPAVRADANKVTWVLTNLVSNALRYVGKDGHIDLSAERIGRLVHLVVRDDGPGIKVEHQSRIFQKFVQLQGQATGGTGLGLAICKEIVRAHGGTIWLESAPGQGSTFTFTLPVSD